MKTISDICYNPQTQQCLDVHLPGASSFPVLVYFHGGGLEGGDKTGDMVFMRHLTDNGIAVVSANYRMYPQAKYPDFLVDAAEAVAWAFNNMPGYGKITGIYIGGSSAGGYISQMLCFDRSYLGRHGISPTDAAGFVLDAGQPTCHYNVLRERGIDTRRVIVDESSALYHIGRDENYPPMLIIVSDNDMENRYEQTQLMASTLRHFGHEDRFELKVMHGGHCAYVGAVDEEGVSVFGRLLCSYIKGE